VAFAIAAAAPAAAVCEEGLVRRTLREPETIDGVRCQDYAWVREGGGLDGCFLAGDQTIDGRPLPAGTRVALDREGHLDWVFLPATTEIAGHRCRGGGHDFMTGFHPGGALRLCWLAEDEEIQGIPCSKVTGIGEMWRGLFSRGRHGGVYFHPDGKLASCRLSRDVTLGDSRYEAGSRVEIDGEGRATAGTAKAPSSCG
jgi:hypothetical protein